MSSSPLPSPSHCRFHIYSRGHTRVVYTNHTAQSNHTSKIVEKHCAEAFRSSTGLKMSRLGIIYILFVGLAAICSADKGMYRKIQVIVHKYPPSALKTLSQMLSVTAVLTCSSLFPHTGLLMSPNTVAGDWVVQSSGSIANNKIYMDSICAFRAGLHFAFPEPLRFCCSVSNLTFLTSLQFLRQKPPITTLASTTPLPLRTERRPTLRIPGACLWYDSHFFGFSLAASCILRHFFRVNNSIEPWRRVEIVPTLWPFLAEFFP